MKKEARKREARKREMCRWAAVCFAAAVLGGCGSEDGAGVKLEDMRVSLNDTSSGDVDTQKSTGQESGVQEDSRTWEEKDEDESESDAGQKAPSQAMAPEKRAMYEAYVAALEDVCFDQVFPGGMECGLQPENVDIGQNKFAVWDIDSDGEEELIIVYTTTYMAGMAAAVYAYDSETGQMREELLGFPSMTFYDNGVVEEGASHNHGMASDGGADGNFWPYSLRRYDAERDSYVPVCSVDAWSKGFREKDRDGNPFPKEADLDGDGVVYYVMEGDYYLADPMDGEEYNQWRESCLNGAKQLEVPYRDLTTDNIYALTNGNAAD